LPGKPANGGNTGGGLVVVSGIVNGASVTGAPGPEEKKRKKKMTFKDAQLRYFSVILTTYITFKLKEYCWNYFTAHDSSRGYI